MNHCDETNRPSTNGSIAPHAAEVPAAVVHEAQDSVVILGRSGVCALDNLEVAPGLTGAALLLRADELLTGAGWTRLGPWQAAPSPSVMARRLGIADNAYAAPVSRMHALDAVSLEALPAVS